jgi:hypothetical protein
MTVRELLELVPMLQEVDPDDVVHIDATSDSILILNRRPGLHQPMADNFGEHEWSDADRQLLRALRVST